MSSNTENEAQNIHQPEALTQGQQANKQTQQKKEIQIQPQQIEQTNPVQNQQNPLMEQENPETQKNLSEIKPFQQSKINQQNSMELNSRIQNNIRNNSLNSLGNQKPLSCHCKKSKCLKMYCQCFAKGIKCRDTCKCFQCKNRPDCQNDEEIQRSEDSNKKSLKPKERSCNCKKSFCLKKYCQCFNANQACTQSCKCEQCKNNGENNSFRQDKNQSSVPINENTFYPIVSNKQISQGLSQQNVIYERKQQQPYIKKRQKLDEDEIETKISQILKLVPQQNYQTMLDFLAYYLS